MKFPKDMAERIKHGTLKTQTREMARRRRQIPRGQIQVGHVPRNRRQAV